MPAEVVVAAWRDIAWRQPANMDGSRLWGLTSSGYILLSYTALNGELCDWLFCKAVELFLFADEKIVTIGRYEETTE